MWLCPWRAQEQLCPPDQVANAPDATVDLTPASDAALVALRERWAALVPGQSVPLLWEMVDAEPCDDR